MKYTPTKSELSEISRRHWFTDPAPEWVMNRYPDEIVRKLHRACLEYEIAELDVAEKSLGLEQDLITSRKNAIRQVTDILGS